MVMPVELSILYLEEKTAPHDWQMAGRIGMGIRMVRLSSVRGLNVIGRNGTVTGTFHAVPATGVICAARTVKCFLMMAQAAEPWSS